MIFLFLSVRFRSVGLQTPYWTLSSTDELDFDYEYYAYVHPEWNIALKYIATIVTRITNYGELYLVNYVPVEPSTAEIFKKITEQVGARWDTFAPWPKEV